jgi:hypothetical protein
VGSAGWRAATTDSPCNVCGKSDWCSVSADRKKAICRRNDDGTGIRKTDKSGQDYWLYDLNGHGRPGLPEDGPPEDRKEPQRANPQTLNRV